MPESFTRPEPETYRREKVKGKTIAKRTRGRVSKVVLTRGGKNNRTELNETEPTEPKSIQTKLKSISNHSVEDFLNSNGSVRFKTVPNRETDVFCNYLN
ncbi:unnamed protein product [Brassica napus]|uniref:(rape) hypothetical protein n=2 Tax=Brassica TaxID=3705 RepID=A0A816SFP8_BRANA|nr:unnamed protein product [Brassica napus]